MSRKNIGIFLGLSLTTIVSVVILISEWSSQSDSQSLETLEETNFSGSVGDGPITDATIRIINRRGRLLSSEFSDNTASYNIRTRTRRRDFPLTIEATGGNDLVTGYGPSFKLVSTALYRSQNTEINLNPFSTLITKTALSMPGGLNSDNINKTKGVVSRHLSFGLDPALVPDPINSRVTLGNIADIVKASEIMAEMFRRTRKALVVGGYDLTDDQIIDILAQDLVDGVVDGRGVDADAHVAATANIVSGQVLVEALINRLRVDEAEATQLLDTAIILTKPSATKLTDKILITREILDQTQIAIAATQTIAPSSELSKLATILRELQPSSLAATIEPMLPNQANFLFDQAILYVVSATDDELEAVNAEVRDRVRNELKEPTVKLRVDSTTVSYNSTVTLTWDSTGADSCTASRAWSGVKGISGNETVGPLTRNSRFAITCTGVNGKARASLRVNVQPSLTPTVTLRADTTSVAYNGTVTLDWSSTEADTCTASGAWSGTKGLSGSESIGTLTDDSSFKLSCLGDGGEASATVLVDVRPQPPTVTLTADTVSVAYNGTVTLSWSSKGTKACTASGAWTGAKGSSGSQSIGALTANSSFLLSCSGDGGEASAALTVEVKPPPPPTLTLTADAASVAYNGTVTLSWSTTDADSCTAFDAWSGIKGPSGNQTTGPLISDSRFRLKCSGVGGEIRARVRVDVLPPPLPTVTFSANASTVTYNGELTLSWSTTDATDCTAAGVWSGIKGISGSESTEPLTGDSSFVLTCTGVGGSVSNSLEVPCSNCSTDFQLTLSWDKIPDIVTGYKVYKGTTAETVSEELSDIPLTTEDFDPELPSITYHFGNDLSPLPGEEQCFMVKAYNSHELSDFSEALCTALW